jgi:hypothetical protein
MWDTRSSKRNPKAPDFKCRDRRCEGVLWPGHHKTATVLVTPPATESGHGQTRVHLSRASKRRATDSAAATSMSQDFVLREVRPKYQDAGVACSDSTVAGIVATLFIQTCKPTREAL